MKREAGFNHRRYSLVIQPTMEENTVRLSPREQQIAELWLQGFGNAEIARKLKMKVRTMKAGGA
jgi:DNA-binding NarL/FixJ family response regulator